MAVATRGSLRNSTTQIEDDASNEVVESSSSASSLEDDSSSGEGDESDSEESEDLVDVLFQESLASLREQDRNEKNKSKAAFADNEDIISLAESRLVVANKMREPIAGPSKSKSLSKKDFDVAYADLRTGKTARAGSDRTGHAAQRQRREEREKTSGSMWFDMPAFPGASNSKRKQIGALSEDEERKARRTRLTNPTKHDGDGRGPSAEDMRREVQAIRLRNAIDPKRFYRGSVSGDRDMPKYAQLGRIISSNSAPASTLNRSERGRTVIEELVRDAETSAYAKKKFNEHQAKSNVAWSSHVRRYPGKSKAKGRTRK